MFVVHARKGFRITSLRLSISHRIQASLILSTPCKILSRNATLTYEHQKAALTVLTRCHPMLMDDICILFNLKSLPEEDLVLLIRTLLTNGKMNEAVTYTWKLGLQKHFNMAEVSVQVYMGRLIL